MTELVLGIDPGLDGGLVMYSKESRNVVAFSPMPTRASHRQGKREVDAVALSEWVETCLATAPDLTTCYLEQVSGRPGQTGQFQFGVNFGVVMGVVQSWNIDVELIPANKWKAAYNLHRGPEETTYAWKQRSIDMAKKIFPHTNFNKSDGIAEAALIAFYGAHK